uniref:Uncharacterized protein n=1 Tax=Parascaris equorum TaxID=6256 RepID=A0A914RUL6_PAREQ
MLPPNELTSDWMQASRLAERLTLGDLVEIKRVGVAEIHLYAIDHQDILTVVPDRVRLKRVCCLSFNEMHIQDAVKLYRCHLSSDKTAAVINVEIPGVCEHRNIKMGSCARTVIIALEYAPPVFSSIRVLKGDRSIFAPSDLIFYKCHAFHVQRPEDCKSSFVPSYVIVDYNNSLLRAYVAHLSTEDSDFFVNVSGSMNPSGSFAAVKTKTARGSQAQVCFASC